VPDDGGAASHQGWVSRLLRRIPGWIWGTVLALGAIGGAFGFGQDIVKKLGDPFRGSSGDVVVLTNGDEHQTVFLNGRPLDRAGFREIRRVPLGSLHSGAQITIEVDNGGGGYAWGFELQHNGHVVYCERAGEVGESGANGNDYSHPFQVVRRVTLTPRGKVVRSYEVGSGDRLGAAACAQALARDTKRGRI
jgi:hypothetical protein